MNRIVKSISSLVFLLLAQCAAAAPVFINEIHYDNSGSDSGEGVEIAGSAGIDLAGWNLVFYNGYDSSPYLQRGLSGVLDEELNGYGALGFSVSGLQNGSPDGIALVDPLDNIIQFLSYEGIITALDGVAAGVTSQDIGVSENSSTLAGMSLQLVGSGSDFGDFSWRSDFSASFGSVNSGQIFLPAQDKGITAGAAVPVPPTLAIMLAGLLGWSLCRSSRFWPRPLSEPRNRSWITKVCTSS